jgi:hypothetical protein
MIKTTSYNQNEIIKNIIDLYCPQGIELDPTYSKGIFYKNSGIDEPLEKFDLIPQSDDTLKANANDLPHFNESISSIMFDPPFIVGHTKKQPSGIIGQRFHGFSYIDDLWKWYSECLIEFYRILEFNGILIVKCQDTVSSGKQWFSHLYIMNEAEKSGFYIQDLFILLAKNRMIGHNHKNQKHARKFHCYFIVLKKKKQNKINHSKNYLE